MQSENVRNTVLFFVIAAAIMIFYQVFVIQPSTERERAAQQARAEAGADLSQRPVDTPAASVYVERPEALALTARVPIATPRLQGSLSLQGARIDDLFLTSYRETLDEEAPVELFRPQGARYAYFAQFGWSGGPNMTGVPGPNTDWTLTEGSTLSPGQPVTLTYDNGEGLRFTRRIEVDEQYVFTLTDTVANLGAQAVTLRPYGSVQRQGVPDQARMFILHEGAIGVLDERLKQEKYKDWAKQGRQTYESTGGWLGITDKYWLASLLPEQDQRIEAEFRVRDVSGVAIHEANMMGEARVIEAGRQITHTQRLFAGAKRAEILRGYERSLDLPRFDQAIDWGMFWFLTRPIFMTVEWFYGLVGNFGVAILLLTVLIKLILFPLANKSYESLSRMRTLAPKLEEIKKKHGADPQKQQQEMMALYQREKINPLAGCLPILLQIPVFYALYKVLFVTIEMRHAPFFGWIRDLSARDPSTIWNVFGLLPYDPATIPVVGGLLNGFLHLGVLPIIYGLTMWLQMSMNPPAPDPVQRKIFAFMPFVFTFILAPFAAGLLIYWAWNNILSIIQQYVIMHRFKAENPIDTFIDRFIKKKPKPS